MINQLTLVGRVVAKPTLRTYSDGYNVCTLTLAVQRSFKNMEGNFETDFIRVSLWNAVANSSCEYLEPGDIVGVKGRIVSKDIEISFEKEGENEGLKKKITILEIIGERVIYIHSYQKKIVEEAKENIYQ